MSVMKRSGAGAISSARASRIALRLLAVSPAPHGISTKCLLRCAASLICCGERSISTAPEFGFLLQKRRDKAAAKRLFKCVLSACPEAPSKIVTEQLRSYPAAKAEIPELANVAVPRRALMMWRCGVCLIVFNDTPPPLQTSCGGP